MSNRDHKPFYKYKHGQWEELSQEEQDQYGFFGLFLLWLQSIAVWLSSIAVFVILAWFIITMIKGCVS